MSLIYLSRRQGNYVPTAPNTRPENDASFWNTTTSLIIRYGVIGAVLLIVIVYFLGGYLHAQRRLRKGKEPLLYHRWMVRKDTYYGAPRPGYFPQRRQTQTQTQERRYPEDSYNMENWNYPPPPPAYLQDNPPLYVPPDGPPPKKMANDESVEADMGNVDVSKNVDGDVHKVDDTKADSSIGLVAQGEGEPERARASSSA